MKTDDFLPLSAPMYSVLITLGERSMHGLGIIETFERATGQIGALLPGSLYNTISCLSKQGLVEEVPPPKDVQDARKRYYRVTDLGREVRAAESARLRALLAMADDAEPIGSG